MKEDWRAVLAEIASHPATFGIFAALARWALGDRAGGWKSLTVYVICSLLVAWAGSYYLADEALTSGRKSFYLLMLAFIAKDLLTALVAIAGQFRDDPIGVYRRIKAALSGGPKQ